MKAIGIILIVLGALGIVMGLMMFGDIGLACLVGALTAVLSGIGFLLVSRRVQERILDFFEEGVMAFCGNCGFEVPEGMKFCPNCGADMDMRYENEE